MDIYNEYASWVKEIQDLYMELKEHHLALYDRFMPIYEVLNHIYQGRQTGEIEKSDDIEKIFSVGYEYLHDQIDTCKMYLEDVFKNDFHAFADYDSVMSSLLYIEDVRYELSEKKHQIDDKKLNDLIEELELLINHQAEIPENLILYVDDVLNTIIKDKSFEFYGIIDIFIDVAETLGLYLFEEEDFVIGKEV